MPPDNGWVARISAIGPVRATVEVLSRDMLGADDSRLRNEVVAPRQYSDNR